MLFIFNGCIIIALFDLPSGRKRWPKFGKIANSCPPCFFAGEQIRVGAHSYISLSSPPPPPWENDTFFCKIVITQPGFSKVILPFFHWSLSYDGTWDFVSQMLKSHFYFSRNMTLHPFPVHSTRDRIGYATWITYCEPSGRHFERRGKCSICWANARVFWRSFSAFKIALVWQRAMIHVRYWQS